MQKGNFSLAARQAELTGAGIPGLFMKYAVPGVVGLLFLGIQTVIDGMVLSHFAGTRALASVSLILPCYNFMVAAALVTGIGCQTLVGIKLGQHDVDSANRALTTAFLFLLAFSVAVSTLIYLFAYPIAGWLGADAALLDGSVRYIRTLIPFFPVLGLMFLGDYMLKLSGRPAYATAVMSGTVVLNILLDLLFVGVWKWGIAGAGLATGIAFTVGAFGNLPPLFKRSRPVCVQRGRFDRRLLGQMLYNGSSEGISELSAGISIFMFNLVLMRRVGAHGVAAFTALEYILYIGVTVFLGISDGIIPVISYNFGSGCLQRVKSVLRLAVRTNLFIGIFLFAALWLAGEQIVGLFFKSTDTEVLDLAVRGTGIFAFAFLFNGLNLLASAYFTAIGNAKMSVIVSLSRGLVFIAIGLLWLPGRFGLDGIWMVIPFAELCTLFVSALLMFPNILRKRPLYA